jgi:hypothetical protein
MLAHLRRKKQQMIIIYILTNPNKNNNKQGNFKVLMITLFELECSFFFKEDSNLHKPCSILVYPSLTFLAKLCKSISQIGQF